MRSAATSRPSARADGSASCAGSCSGAFPTLWESESWEVARSDSERRSTSSRCRHDDRRLALDRAADAAAQHELETTHARSRCGSNRSTRRLVTFSLDDLGPELNRIVHGRTRATQRPDTLAAFVCRGDLARLADSARSGVGAARRCVARCSSTRVRSRAGLRSAPPMPRSAPGAERARTGARQLAAARRATRAATPGARPARRDRRPAPDVPRPARKVKAMTDSNQDLAERARPSASRRELRARNAVSRRRHRMEPSDPDRGRDVRRPHAPARQSRLRRASTARSTSISSSW